MTTPIWTPRCTFAVQSCHFFAYCMLSAPCSYLCSRLNLSLQLPQARLPNCRRTVFASDQNETDQRESAPARLVSVREWILLAYQIFNTIHSYSSSIGTACLIDSVTELLAESLCLIINLWMVFGANKPIDMVLNSLALEFIKSIGAELICVLQNVFVWWLFNTRIRQWILPVFLVRLLILSSLIFSRRLTLKQKRIFWHCVAHRETIEAKGQLHKGFVFESNWTLLRLVFYFYCSCRGLTLW